MSTSKNFNFLSKGKTWKSAVLPSPEQAKLWQKYGYTQVQYSPPQSTSDVIVALNNTLDFQCFVHTITCDEDLRHPLPHGGLFFCDIQPTSRLDRFKLADFLKKNPNLNFYFSFPIHFNQDHKLLSLSQVHFLVTWLKSQSIQIQTRHDLPTQNVHIDTGLYFETTAYEICCERKNKITPTFSIIIPVYNNKKNLRLTLDKIQFLFLNSDISFEVVLCDDGSTDGLIQDFQLWKKQFTFDFCLISIPRYSQRQMGDLNYRAGLARNAAVMHAQGHNLLFIDCDILIPENTLVQLKHDLQSADIVMCRRSQLDLSFTHLTATALKQPEKFKNKNQNSYWQEFYESAKTWNQQPECWKYLSSNSLAISKKNFELTKGFKNNYNVYGYEDVNLGYDAKQLGLSFKLSTLEVFHIPPPEDRSEYQFDLQLRSALFQKSSEIFYFNTLDDQVFSHIQCHFFANISTTK